MLYAYTRLNHCTANVIFKYSIKSKVLPPVTTCFVFAAKTTKNLLPSHGLYNEMEFTLCVYMVGVCIFHICEPMLSHPILPFTCFISNQVAY